MDKRYCPINVLDNKDKGGVLFIYCQEEKCMWYCPDLKECVLKGLYMEMIALNEKRMVK